MIYVFFFDVFTARLFSWQSQSFELRETFWIRVNDLTHLWCSILQHILHDTDTVPGHSHRVHHTHLCNSVWALDWCWAEVSHADYLHHHCRQTQTNDLLPGRSSQLLKQNSEKNKFNWFQLLRSYRSYIILFEFIKWLYVCFQNKKELCIHWTNDA